MRKAYHPKIRFYIGESDGHFVNNGWLNKHCIVFNKKTDALKAGNQILTSEGQIYAKATYGRKLYNDGIFQIKKDFEDMVSAFTEDILIKYALGDENEK